MPTYPITYIALLQSALVLFGGALIHRHSGEYVWAFLCIPIAWTFMASYMQANFNGFWRGTALPYFTGVLILALLICFFGAAFIALLLPPP
jgi:hypothetical protein